MAAEKNESTKAPLSAGENARVQKMQAARKVRSAMIAQLPPGDQFLLRNVVNAKRALDVLEDRILHQQPITGEAVQACSVLSGQVALLAGN